MNIEYVLATKADIPLLVELRIFFSNELTGRPGQKAEADLRSSMNDYFEKELNKTYFCWYAKVNGTAASVGGLGIRNQPGNYKNPSGRWGYIMSVYTIPEFRRQGLSGNILNRLIATGIENGVTAFELHATKDGEPIYVKNGFVLHKEPTYRKFFEQLP